MNKYRELLEHIGTLKIVDTHEHLPAESDRPADSDVLSEWLTHYFSCDLVSAGLSDSDMALVRDSGGDLKKRWRIVEPFWRDAANTGYGRSLQIAAKGIYGVDNICEDTIAELDSRFRDARKKGGHYKFVLAEKSRIAVSVCDSVPIPYKETHEDPFVYAFRTDEFVSPGHYGQMRKLAMEVDMEIHTMADWMEVTKRHVERCFDGKKRVVCLKCPLAYQRSLRFEKVASNEAENAFCEFFKDENLPLWRSGIKTPRAFSDRMMHFTCELADAHRLAYQVHTGIQEGNGNILSDSNPTLLSNLFLEYRNARFDLFHMGYPYVMETGTMAKNFRNVFIDMCWGHIISPEAARRALSEWLDAVPANKISAFGGDYCFVDGVYGHLALARENVAKSLAPKVEDASISLDRAKEIASMLFFSNPVSILGLQRFANSR